MNSLIRGMADCIRKLSREPAVAAAIITLLALSVASTTTAFGLIDTILLQPLPFARPDQLMSVQESNPAARLPTFSVAPLNYLDWARSNRSFQEIAAYKDITYNLSDGARSATVTGVRATSNLFDTLGAGAFIGRTLVPADDRPGAAKVVVLSYAFWRRQFDGAAEVVGRTMNLNQNLYQIVGVMPKDFELIKGSEFWIPIAFSSTDLQERGLHYLSSIARLRPGVTRQQAMADLNGIAVELEKKYPNENTHWRVVLTPYADMVVGNIRPILWSLGAISLSILATCCANIASLTLSRSILHRRAVAIKFCLGASSWDLARNALAETAVLSGAGAGLGLLISNNLLSIIAHLGSDSIPRVSNIHPDFWQFAYTVGLALVLAIGVALLPMLGIARADLRPALENAATPAPSHRRIFRLLMITEISISTAVCVIAASVVLNLYRILHTDPGFVADKAFVSSINLPPAKYRSGPRQIAFFRQLLQADPSAELPGRMGLSTGIPLRRTFLIKFRLENVAASKSGPEMSANLYRIAGDYFGALSASLVQGRGFSDQDGENSVPVAIVNSALVATYFGSAEPIGRYLTIENGPNSRRCLIVGVVEDIKNRSLTQPASPQVYTPFWQDPSDAAFLLIRSEQIKQMQGRVASRVLQLDPGQPIGPLIPLSELALNTLASRRLSAFCVALFGVVALCTTIFGLYSLAGEAARQREKEMALRTMLGARRGHIIRISLLGNCRYVVAGTLLGLILTAIFRQRLRQVLPGLETIPLSLGGSVVVLQSLALLAACLPPAFKSSSTDPLQVLRQS